MAQLEEADVDCCCATNFSRIDGIFLMKKSENDAANPVRRYEKTVVGWCFCKIVDLSL